MPLPGLILHEDGLPVPYPAEEEVATPHTPKGASPKGASERHGERLLITVHHPNCTTVSPHGAFLHDG
jgi:hypothetical protein